MEKELKNKSVAYRKGYRAVRGGKSFKRVLTTPVINVP
jgi:hypothetical protein